MEFPSAKPARNKDEPLLIGPHNSSLLFKVNQLFKNDKKRLTPAAPPTILNLKFWPGLYYIYLLTADFSISRHLDSRPAVSAKNPSECGPRGNMIPGFDKIVEERIQRALKKGEFDNLPGCGRPLELEDNRHIPEDLRLAHKILKNADCLPPEVELKKQIRCTEDLLASMPDSVEKYRTLKKLNYLIMKLNTLRNTSAALDLPQHYLADLAERFGSKSAPDKSE